MNKILLKNGTLVDGTGSPGTVGDLLIAGDLIETIAPGGLPFEGNTLDCTGKIIAPGFIDAHSHMDWALPIDNDNTIASTFTAQGITTFVGGNCGFGVAGFMEDSPYRQQINPGLFPDFDLSWSSMAEYFDHLETQGMSHNLLNLAGHGTSRISVRGMDPSPLQATEMKQLLRLLEAAMEEGAAGVSLGLMYETGLFATKDELRNIADLVRRKDKILTVHGKAYSILSADYPPNPFGKPHNLRALEDMITLARDSEVRLQYSHLMFAGTKTHRTCDACLDALLDSNTNIATDSYPYHCGESVLKVLLPKWFRENLPANFGRRLPRMRLAFEMKMMTRLVGLDYSDIRITHAQEPKLKAYEGCTLAEIAQKMKCTPLNAMLICAEESNNAPAWIMLHKYSTPEIVDSLMQSPHCLFQTDVVPTRNSPNPSAYAAFPRFLQRAREHKTLSLEGCVQKMTGATAERFHMKDRGLLKAGYAADITIFDWESVADNDNETHPGNPPTGIEAVFINGKQVVAKGQPDKSVLAGKVIRQ